MNDWISDVLATVGIFIGVAGFIDGRRQRTKRHQSELIISRLIGRLNGFLIGVKTGVQHDEVTTRAVNDCLSAIKESENKLANLEKS